MIVLSRFVVEPEESVLAQDVSGKRVRIPEEDGAGDVLPGKGMGVGCLVVLGHLHRLPKSRGLQMLVKK